MLYRPCWCIVRAGIADPDRTVGVRRLIHADSKTGDIPALVEAPRVWLAIDLDDVPRPDSVPAADLAACAALGVATLPPEFHGVRCLAQATAGHGIKPVAACDSGSGLAGLSARRTECLAS